MTWNKAEIAELEAYQARLDEIDDLDKLEKLMKHLEKERYVVYLRIDVMKAKAKVWTRFMHKAQSRIQAVKTEDLV